MSRSYKKPFVKCTGQIEKEEAHRQLRRKVKAELDKPEPDLNKLDVDTRDIGVENHGTRYGFHYVDPDDVVDVKSKKEMRRK